MAGTGGVATLGVEEGRDVKGWLKRGAGGAGWWCCVWMLMSAGMEVLGGQTRVGGGSEDPLWGAGSMLDLRLRPPP